ncbi:MAG: Uma2 family endonuclease [Oscillatoriales cyanobacterium SM2_2_1]|nr:Uma2 family endonuclease [Oscillatoriales cyanobacterium SM2_2_1]
MMKSLISEPIQNAIAEKRMAFHNVTWQTYQELTRLLGDRPVRISFDGDTLEMVMPLEFHEFAARLIERFLIVLTLELEMPFKTMGSTTLNREDLARGAEPDNAYYIQNQPLVKGRNIDLSSDPPPDLVVEVDITHTDLKKLELYAALGVPEFWRYDGRAWRIYGLAGDCYQELECSPTFPKVPKSWLYEFLLIAREDEITATKELQKKARTLGEKP